MKPLPTTLLLLAACTAPQPYRPADPLRIAQARRISETRRDLADATFLLRKLRDAEAEPLLRKALDASRDIGDPILHLEALHAWALFLLDHNDLPTALDHLEHALTIARTQHLRRNEAEILNNTALVLLRLNRPAEAETRLRQALRLSPPAPVKLHIRNNLGLCLSLQGRDTEALRLLARNAKTAHKQTVPEAEISALLLTADILAKSSPHQALPYARQAYDAADYWNLDRLRLAALQRLADLYDRTGRTTEAEHARQAAETLAARRSRR